MNDKIKELAEQSGMGSWGVGNGDNVSEIIEKFAKLIIQECISVIEDFGTDVENGDIFRLAKYKGLLDDIKNGHIGPIAWEAATKVKEHFE